MAPSIAFGLGFATVLVLLMPSLLSLHESLHGLAQRFGGKPETASIT